ncbi:tripartite tricarboxylate transporter permease [Fertoebacter nigrum]|uniref:Tripartite tricarboxylate transporter permease n=1 Tax=Fertoeibacter niger TaxID=2656921 RepID=A0A8X8GWG2_9RHOB|nr:tripartite tricarboxylate transporter permease [Fertoeibacter niger]
MSQQGRGKVALLMATAACFLGGTIGIPVVITLEPFIACYALRSGPPEQFAQVLLGPVAYSSVAVRQGWRGCHPCLTAAIRLRC